MIHDNEKRMLRRLSKPTLGSGLSLGMTGGGNTTPALDLNFLSGTLDSRITFARASAATRVNASGLIESVSPNVARFDHDPITLAPTGLLIEEPRTNLCFPSAMTGTGGGWNTSAGTLTANAGTAPDGTNAATLLTCVANSSNKAVYKQNATATTVQANSVFAKAGTTHWLGLGFDSTAQADGAFFDLQNGTVGTVAAGCTAAITPYANGWYRCTAVRSYISGNHYFNMEPHTADNQGSNWTSAGTETIFIWGGQSEAGAFATSLIPTTAGQAIRAGDDVSMTGANFLNWFNTAEGTILISAELPAAINAVWPSIYDTSVGTQNLIEVYKKTTTTMSGNVFAAGVGQTDMQPQALSANLPHNLAFAYKLNSSAVCADGGAVITDNDTLVPTGLANLSIGRYKDTGTGYINNHVRSLRYYRIRLADATLQTITI